jgi:hypothetical protein
MGFDLREISAASEGDDSGAIHVLTACVDAQGVEIGLE